jgi:hypothetical protein
VASPVAGVHAQASHRLSPSPSDDRAKLNNGSFYDGILNQYYNEVSPYGSLVPYMSSSGNHEILGSDADGDFLAYRKRISPTLPWQASGGSEFWYSFNQGPAHFVAFDIDQPYKMGTAQQQWLFADLAAVDRTITPWVIAFSHFPMACSNFFWCLPAASGPEAFRAIYEPVFNAPATKVDVFMAGHVHAAELLYPQVNMVKVQDNFVDVNVTLHLMAGFPGDMEVCCNKWQQPKPSWSAWRDDDVHSDGGTFGFSQFTLVNDTHVLLQMFDSANETAILTQWVSRRL